MQICILFYICFCSYCSYFIITSIDVSDLRRAFEEADEDGSGNIDKKEMKRMLKKMGNYPGDKEFEVLFKETDTDGKRWY